MRCVISLSFSSTTLPVARGSGKLFIKSFPQNSPFQVWFVIFSCKIMALRQLKNLLDRHNILWSNTGNIQYKRFCQANQIVDMFVHSHSIDFRVPLKISYFPGSWQDGNKKQSISVNM